MADKNKTSFLREALVSLVKVQDLLYKNELDVIYYKVLRVSHGGKIIEYLTTKREIYC
jgi:hypothetical protein